MHKTHVKIIHLFLLAFFTHTASTGFSADANKGKAKGKETAAPEVDEELNPPPKIEEPTPLKIYSAAEKRQICQRYEGRVVAFYGELYKIEKCKKRAITDSKTVYDLQRHGSQVVEGDNDAIAALEDGDSLDEAVTAQTARSCKELEGRYITYSSVDVYWVEACKKRLFPDWTTYIKHRESRGDKKGEILAVSQIEFDRLSSGKDIPSVVDDMFAKLLTGSAQVEVIPVNEACRGLEGKLASFYSRIYRIERCKKRELTSPDITLRRSGANTSNIVEMKSEQWLSLSDGAPITDNADPQTGAPMKPIKSYSR